MRIRPGRSWRLNPGYLDRLAGLSAPHARRFDAGSILDVVGIEIDGVDIAAGIGEAQVLLAVAELAEALVRLGQGAPAAQATVGPGPTEVVLEARGSDVLLALVRLQRPGRVIAGGLLVDCVKLRAAALQAARGLLADLLEIGPALRSTPVAQRLARAAQHLSRRPSAGAPPWPPPASASSGLVRSLVMRSGRGALRCEVQLPLEAAERLAAPIEGALLASLLARGAIALRIPGAPALAFEAPLFLALRDALAEASSLVHAWEAGEPSFQVPLGPLELRFDLTRDQVDAAGWTRPAQATAPQVALALAGAARTYAARALRLAGERAALLEPLRDLAAAAGELLRHCRDLASGALRRAPDAVVAPTLPRPPHHELLPLQPAGRVRRIVFREAFSARLPCEPAALWVCGREAASQGSFAPPSAPSAVAALLEGAVEAFSLDAGRPLWGHACVSPRAATLAEGGPDLLVLGPEALLRLDPTTGRLRWRRALAARPGPQAALFPLPRGVLVADGGALTLVSAAGSIEWRARLEQAPRAVLAHESLLLLALPGGMLTALEGQSGRALWRRRVSVRAGPPLLCAGRLILAGERARKGEPLLLALDAQTGQPAWEAPLERAPEAPAASNTGDLGQRPNLALPGPLPAVAASGELVFALSGEGVRCLRAADGAPRWTAALPWGAAGFFTALDELDAPPRSPRGKQRRAPVLACAGPGGGLLALDALGGRAWLLPPEGEAQPERPLSLRGLIATAAGGLRLSDAVDGLEVAHLGGPRSPSRWAAAADLTLALCEGAELSVHLLATHLSLV